MRAPLISLYTPGSRPDLIEKAVRYDPDAIIIDLEDSVAIDRKDAARRDVSALLPSLHVPVVVRVNSEPEYLRQDLDAVVSPYIYGIALPMTESAADVHNADAIIAGLEADRGIAPGTMKLIPLIETALGVYRCFEISTAAARVESVAFGSAEDGDLQRNLKCAWSAEGTEMLYARSRVLLEARAAGLPYVLDGAFSDIGNPEALRADCLLSKRLGYDGRTLIHPSQVAPARELYVASAEDVAYYRRLVTAFEDAEASGRGAIALEGKLVDYAMYRKAQELLAAIDGIPVAPLGPPESSRP